jgi:hypothetical protein
MLTVHPRDDAAGRLGPPGRQVRPGRLLSRLVALAILKRDTCFQFRMGIVRFTAAHLLRAGLGHSPSPVLARFVPAFVSKRKSGMSLAGLSQCNGGRTLAVCW